MEKGLHTELAGEKIPNLRTDWRSKAKFIKTGVLQSRGNSFPGWQRQCKVNGRVLLTTAGCVVRPEPRTSSYEKQRAWKTICNHSVFLTCLFSDVGSNFWGSTAAKHPRVMLLIEAFKHY